MKTCRKCKAQLPATTEYFYPTYDVVSGLRSICKTCHKSCCVARAIHRYKTNEECRSKQILSSRSWYARNRRRASLRNRVYREQHLEHLKNRAKLWRKVNQIHIIAARRTYRETNRNRIVEAGKTWRCQNPLKRRAIQIAYRARKKSAAGRFTDSEIAGLFIEQAGLCFYCERPIRSFDVEHKVPLCRGGTNEIGNLALACHQCNGQKGTLTDQEFAGRKMTQAQARG